MSKINASDSKTCSFNVSNKIPPTPRGNFPTQPAYEVLQNFLTSPFILTHLLLGTQEYTIY